MKTWKLRKHSTLISSERWRIWSTQIFIFHIFITQNVERSLRWFSILLENESFENPGKQAKLLANLLVLNKLIEKSCATKGFVFSSRSSWCNLFFLKTLFKGSHCKWSKKLGKNVLRFSRFSKFKNHFMLQADLLPLDSTSEEEKNAYSKMIC